MYDKRIRERERIKTDQMNLKKNHREFLEVTNIIEIEASGWKIGSRKDGVNTIYFVSYWMQLFFLDRVCGPLESKL